MSYLKDLDKCVKKQKTKTHTTSTFISHSSPKKQSKIEYTRLLLLDDATLENSWVENFLDTINSLARKVTVEPTLYMVESPSRTWVRMIQSVLPRAAITLVSYTTSRSEKYVYISLSPITDANGLIADPVFAISMRSKEVYDNLISYLQKIVRNDNPFIRKIQASSDIHLKSLPRALPGLTERLLSSIEELAQSNKVFKHIGVFGSVPGDLVGLNCGSKQMRYESDLDLIVVVSSGDHEDLIKHIITERFVLEASHKQGIELELEWSLERSTFYYFRKGFHVDIQLHNMGDDYYVTNAKLLGYSIFWGRYHTIYSTDNLPVDTFVHVPTRLLSEYDRLTLFLNDPLGLLTFVEECSKGDVRIDPRRVLAINLGNWLWATSGMHPISSDHTLQIILTGIENGDIESNTYTSLPKSTLDLIDDVMQQQTQFVMSRQPEYLTKALSVLDELKHRTLQRVQFLNGLSNCP